jgi:hypothetical protein
MKLNISEEQFNLIIKTCCPNRAARAIASAKLVIFDGLTGYAAEKQVGAPPNQTYGILKIVEREIKFYNEMRLADENTNI